MFIIHEVSNLVKSLLTWPLNMVKSQHYRETFCFLGDYKPRINECVNFVVSFMHVGLPENVFDPVSHPTSLDLTIHTNPLVCGPLSCWIKHSNWVTVLNPTTTLCECPVNLAGHSWDVLDETELNCQVSGRYTITLIGINQS